MSSKPVVGIDSEAYALRMKGYSPESIRDAVWELVKDDLQGKILDTGSGEGGWIGRIKARTNIQRIVSLDIVDDGASKIEGVEFHLCDISKSSLPCLTDELDWIFALEVLEHLANPRNFIAESYRCLKSGGRLVVTTPCNDSLTAKLSFLFRGYFPEFCDASYHSSGHITPISELDLMRMSSEAQFSKIEFRYPLPGRIPKTGTYWQTIFPFLKGKLWTDCLIAVLTK